VGLLDVKQKKLVHIAGMMLCFILFAVSVFYAEEIPLLIIAGILGLSGVWYFSYRLVSITIEKRKQ
jgi:hypothetical protein